MAGDDSTTVLFEWRRKLFHILIGLIFGLLFYFEIMKFWIGAAIVVLGIFISWAYMHVKIPVIDWFLKTFERPKHIKEFPGRGVIAICLSMTVLTFFDKNIALASVMVWTFGDTVAALFGMHFGVHKYKNKTWEGFVAGLIAATISALVFVPLYAAFFGALAAMLLELLELDVWHFDDNVFVPLASAIVMFVLLFL